MTAATTVTIDSFNGARTFDLADPTDVLALAEFARLASEVARVEGDDSARLREQLRRALNQRNEAWAELHALRGPDQLVGAEC